MRECYLNIDRKGREMVNHGSPSFPCACYHTSSHQVDVAWHWHEEFELIYLNSGTVRCSAGDRRFLLHGGEAAFINAGVPHTLFQRLGEPYDEHDIVFHARLVYGEVGSVFYDKYLLPLLRCTALPGFKLSPEIPWQKEAISHLRLAVSCLLEKRDLYELSVRSALSAFLGLLWKENQNVIGPAALKPPASRERVQKMLDYFHSHYQDPVTLDELSAQANICKRECQRVFKSVLGLTPSQYFEQYRLSLSVSLLLNTRESIIDISGKCGFQSPSYFTKVFHKRYGLTPTEFRASQAAPPASS